MKYSYTEKIALLTLVMQTGQRVSEHDGFDDEVRHAAKHLAEVALISIRDHSEAELDQ